MNKRLLRAACHFRLLDNIKSLLIMCGVFLLVMMFLTLVFNVAGDDGAGGTSSFGGSDMAFAITIFIFGIAAVRADLNLFTLFGASRRTSFFAIIIAAALTAFCAAIMNLLLMLLFGAASEAAFPGSGTFVCIYDMLFRQGSDGVFLPRTAAGTIAEIGIAALCFWLLNCFGALISLIYYRLGKWGKTLLSVIGGALLFIGIPFGSSLPQLKPLYAVIGKFVSYATSAPEAAALCITALLLPTIGGSWLLLRRASLK